MEIDHLLLGLEFCQDQSLLSRHPGQDEKTSCLLVFKTLSWKPSTVHSFPQHLEFSKASALQLLLPRLVFWFISFFSPGILAQVFDPLIMIFLAVGRRSVLLTLRSVGIPGSRATFCSLPTYFFCCLSQHHGCVDIFFLLLAMELELVPGCFVCEAFILSVKKNILPVLGAFTFLNYFSDVLHLKK